MYTSDKVTKGLQGPSLLPPASSKTSGFVLSICSDFKDYGCCHQAESVIVDEGLVEQGRVGP